MTTSNSAGRFIPTFTDPTPHTTIAALFEDAKRIHPDQRLGVLVAVAELARGTSHQGFHPSLQVTVGAMAGALLAVRETLTPRGANPSEPRIDTFPPLAIPLIKRAQGLVEDAYYASEESDELSRDAVLANWWSQISRSSLYQGDTTFRVANVLVLSGLRGIGNLGPDPEVNRLFFQEFGISADDYALLLFGLWSIALQNCSFSPDTFLQTSPRSAELTPAFAEILNDLSIPATAPIRSHEFAHLLSLSGQGIGEAFFARWPLITYGQYHLVSNHTFLCLQLTNKFLAKALALARATEGRSDTAFSRLVSRRFEDTVDTLLTLADIKFKREYEYDARNNRQSPDFILPSGDAPGPVALLQLKLKAFTELALYGASVDAIYDDVGGAFADCVVKTVKFLKHLHDARASNHLRTEHLLASERILAASELWLVGITPDAPTCFTSQPLREKFVQDVATKLGPALWQWFTQLYQGRWHWHIFSLNEFETFCSLPPVERDLAARLKEYVSAAKLDEPEAGLDLPADFRSFLINKHKAATGAKIPPLPELASVFSQFARDVQLHFGFTPRS